ncbi:MAG: AAA family ATPase [Pseudanabaena sp.]
MNVNQILKYSCQFIAVDVAINQSLAITHSDVLLERIAALSDEILDWDILQYASASFHLSSLNLSDRISSEDVDAETEDKQNYLRVDTYAHSAAAAFWYLHIENISKSVTVFENLRHIENGEEMYQIACFLLDISKVKNIKDIHNIKKPTFPRLKILRVATWSLLKKITLVIEDVHIVCFARSRVAKSFALNRALGQISEVLNEIESLPDNISRVERPIIHKTTNQWKELLIAESRKIGKIEIDKPIPSPYIIGDPVFGNNFIGREDILSQLESLWIVNSSPQSIILYGHRRMGKTSILRNIPTNLGYQVRVAYVNLLSIGSAPNGITDILMAICEALQEVTDIPYPNNNDLFQFPETAFRRYLQHIEKNFAGTGLIIALDEFEKIEELIDAGKLSKDFLGFLRGMVQMSSKLAFAFAGLHTLQEMNADYFQPFYASFIPISVAFLSREATRQVLANPDPEFLLEYEPAALDHIYDLTNGQPYLTQLIGFQLVRMFNDYVFEQGKPRDRTFTIDDVRTICSGENFFNTGINYFNGVWQQAAEGAAHQQDILKALAPHPQGLTESELISQTNLPSATLQAALKTLKDHDVIRSQKTNEIVNWAMAVELFRTWVVKYKLSDT